MLDKATCRICQYCKSFEFSEGDFNDTWDIDGLLFCPVASGPDNFILSIYANPPKDCPYLLEQLLSSQAIPASNP